MVRRQGETCASDLYCPDVRSALEIYIERVGESRGVLAANVDKVSPGGGGACLRRSKNAESARRTVPPKTYYRNSFSDDQTDARPWRANSMSHSNTVTIRHLSFEVMHDVPSCK